jgi:hypothetical protein
MGAAEENLSGAVARQPALQERFVDRPYAGSFARMQGMRMQSGFCAQWRVIYPQRRSLRAAPFGRSNQSALRKIHENL